VLYGGLRKLAALNELTCSVARNVAGFMLVLMVIIVILQIIFRYLLNDSLVWTEEVARTMMVWTAFLVAPWAYRYSINVRIGLFSDELASRQRMFLNLMINLLICWILMVFLIESVGFWSRGLSIRSDSLPIQVAWFYSIVPVALFMLLLVGLELVLRSFLSIIDPSRDVTLLVPDDLVDGES